jgi:hypothetical protein
MIQNPDTTQYKMITILIVVLASLLSLHLFNG